MLVEIILEVPYTSFHFELLLLSQLTQVSHELKELSAVELIIRPADSHVAHGPIRFPQLRIECFRDRVLLRSASLSARPTDWVDH